MRVFVMAGVPDATRYGVRRGRWTVKRPCDYIDCGDRRAHHEMPDTTRGTRLVDVPDDYPAEKRVYCSITCACMAGAYNVRTGWL